MHWHVKDQGIKSSMPAVGMLYFTRTRFQNKETKETAYLLDRVLGLLPHARMDDGVKAAFLEETVQTSYEKAGREACLGEYVSREIIMRHVRGMEIPAKSMEESERKRMPGNCMLKQMRIMRPYSSIRKKGYKTL